jgi:hypothetical protein
MKGTKLEAEKNANEMTKGKARIIKSVKVEKPAVMTSAQKAYIAALEAELADQHLRVILYQGILSAASEQYGEDIVKKIGGHRSGP